VRNSFLLSIMITILLTTLLGSQPISAPTQKATGPGQPLSPAEAVKQFRIAPGLRIELVAAEPLVQSPVDIAFDADGRLWVVEMPDYPNGPPKGKPPEGRIRILEDKKGDGVYDHATTFAGELLFANGLLPWRDGVIVTVAPCIVNLQDPQGLGRWTKKEVLFEGFAAQNPQLRVSHPILGLDGWVYVANGLRGGQVIRGGSKNAKPLNLSGLDFRFDPMGNDYEAISGPGQFGNTFDDWGNRFICDNRHHLRHVVLENRYVRRNPYLAPPALVEDISELDEGPLYSGGAVYPISKNWTTSSLHEGRFTAACGVHIYRGNLLPKEFQGAAFTCEPTGNLVHMEVMTPRGATFESKPPRPGVEFLATPDDWFRPVSMASGPDGALYIVDMYRAVIEHPEFMPPELKNRPDLTFGKDKGRIWRIVPEGYRTKTVRPNLAKASTKELVATLENPDGWWRTTAARLLFERKDAEARVLLNKLVSTTQDARARIQAGWLLARNSDFPLAFPLQTPQPSARKSDVAVVTYLRTMLLDPNPRVREAGVLIAEGQVEIIGHIAKALAEYPDARVRYQVALAIGNWHGEAKADYLAKIALAGASDKWTRLAVASSAGDCAGKVLEQFLASRKEFDRLPLAQRTTLIQEFAGLIGAHRDPNEVEDTLKALALIEGTDAFQIQLPAMSGLADGVTRRGGRLADMMAKLPSWKDKDAGIVNWLKRFEGTVRDFAVKPKEEPALRLQAVRYLAHLPLPQVQEALARLVEEDPSQEMRVASVRALAAHPERQVPQLLLKPWRSYTPAVRREVLEAVCRDPLRINILFDEIEAKRFKPGDVDPSRARQLLAHGNPGIRERAQRLLRDSLPADRKLVLEKYQIVLAMDGDPKRGREIFKKNCATCHKVAGIGIDVGPDIADSRTKTESALLVDILNPNQAIDNNYINYLVTTKQGRTLTGLLAAETASSLTLKRAEGQTDAVLRQDIDMIESTGVSLMPEGLEKTISFQEMADLLKFLKNWRYLDGSVPLGK
jgi:putative membrane-bound dehydrogenase-like protein